jgi:hypothetical protein
MPIAAKPITAKPWARRAVLALGLLLSGCYGNPAPPPQFAPLDYSYLPTLKLDVARIDIDANWVPRGSARHVEYLSPTTPLAALRQMAQDRLFPGGSSGEAKFVIDDASIIQGEQNFTGDMAVHLDLLADDGTQLGTADARVQAIRPITDADDPDAVRSDLYALTRTLMDQMNVELEYRIRRSLSRYLQATSPTAPLPGAVDTQDLSAPGKP